MNRTHKSNIKSKATTFAIKTTAKAFEILSSGIYSNKIRAVIRELSCNAYDSHVEAGKPEVPFKLHLPDAFEPEFSVEDFGVGMSPEVVEELYTTYFSSTKTDTNDLIGGLGLGSKSPFCYTDQFTVRSRKDGVECIYGAYISSDGAPSIQKKSERATTEPNGVKVSLAVDPSDFQEFYSEAQEVFKFFRVQPECNKNLGTDDYINFEILDSHGMIGKNTWRNELHIVMGNVAYFVSTHSTIINKFESWIKEELRSGVNYFFKFDIGSLNVAASRETISFDEETTENFINRITYLMNGALSRIQKDIDLLPSLSEKFEYFMNHYSMDSHFAKKAMYKDNSIRDWYQLRTSYFINKCVLKDRYTEEGDPVYSINMNDRRELRSLRDIYTPIRSTLCGSEHFQFLFTDPEVNITKNQIYNYIRRSWRKRHLNLVVLTKSEVRELEETYVDLEGNTQHKKGRFTIKPDDSDLREINENIKEYFGEDDTPIRIITTKDILDAWSEHREEIKEKSRETRRLKLLEGKKGVQAVVKPTIPRIKKNEFRVSLVNADTSYSIKTYDHIVDLNEIVKGRYLVAKTIFQGRELCRKALSSSIFEMRCYNPTPDDLATFCKGLVEIFGLDGILLVKNNSQLERLKEKIEAIGSETILYKLGIDDIKMSVDEINQLIKYKEVARYASNTLSELELMDFLQGKILKGYSRSDTKLLYKHLRNKYQCIRDAEVEVDKLNDKFYNKYRYFNIGYDIYNKFTPSEFDFIETVAQQITEEVTDREFEIIERRYPFLLKTAAYERTPEMEETYMKAMDLFYESNQIKNS